MKKFISFIGGFFLNKPDSPSIKRLCGLLCVITLCITMYYNSFSEEHIAPSAILVESIALLAFGCLGLTASEKIASIFKSSKDETKEELNNNTANTEAE